jgi:oligosaccharide repeat unit polymerase
MTLIKALQIFGALLLLNLVIIYFLLVDQSDIAQYLRYDKYPLYLDIGRSIIIIFTLFISMLLFHRYVISLNTFIFLPSNLFLFLFLFLVFPGVILSSDFTLIGVTSFYTYLAALIFYVIGSILASLAMRFNGPTEISKYQNQPILVYKASGVTYTTIIFILLASFIYTFLNSNYESGIITYIIDFIKTGMVPDDARNIADSRISIYSEEDYRSTSATIASYMSGLLLPLSASFILISGIVKRKKLEIFLGLLLASFTFVSLISDGSRLRGMFYILYLVVLVSHVWRIRFRSLAYSAIAAFSLLTLHTIALGRMVGADGYLANIIMSLNRVIERLILVKGYVTQEVFHYIPWVTSYRLGQTYIDSLAGTLNKGTTFAEEMSHFIYGPAGTAGPQAFGEAYANFGVIGALGIAFILGFIIHLITIFIIRRRKRDILSLIFVCYLIVLVSRTGYGDLFTFKTNGMHVLLALWMMIIIMRKFLNSSIRKKQSVTDLS